MEPSGIEPPTSALRTQRSRDASAANTGLTGAEANACTSACTEKPELAQMDARDGDFAEALVMIARLPLTDAERAEAVRRLLAQAEGSNRR